jgi:hypothetical protein
MTRVNFTKIEQLIEERLRKMSIERLLYLADVAKHIGEAVSLHTMKPSTESKKETEEGKKMRIRQKASAKLYTNLLKLYEKDSKIYAKLRIKKSSADRLINKNGDLNDLEWEIVEELVKKTQKYMEQYYPHMSDEELVENEMKRHINKRFNVSEKWLPLQ